MDRSRSTLTKKEFLKKKEQFESVKKYKEKLDKIAYRNKFNLTPEKMLHDEIEQGKYPDLLNQRNELEQVYLAQ